MFIVYFDTCTCTHHISAHQRCLLFFLVSITLKIAVWVLASHWEYWWTIFQLFWIQFTFFSLDLFRNFYENNVFCFILNLLKRLFSTKIGKINDSILFFFSHFFFREIFYLKKSLPFLYIIWQTDFDWFYS